MLKIPFQFFWNIQNIVLSSKQSACFAHFSISTKIAVTGPYRLGHFFWLIFWNVENTLRILLKHSKFFSFIKTISLKQKQHVLQTFQFWRKSLYPDLTGLAIFFVDFLKCWKYPSNSSETFKMLFFHQNNQFEAKTACFADFSILTKITVSGPYRRGHFLGWFFWLSFSNVENTLRILLKHSNFVVSSKEWVSSNNSMFGGLFNFDQNRCIRTLPAWPFFWLIFWNVENTLPIPPKLSKCCSFIKTISLKPKQHVLRTFQFWPKSLYPDLTGLAIFFGWFFEMLKIPFEFSWNIQNFSLSSKQSVWSKNSMFCRLFNFDENRCIRTLPAWQFFLLIFWNVENTLPILLKHSKCCSSIKTISLKQRQHVLRTFQFWPKSPYPDLTGVAILLVDFFGWVFQMLKIPFEFSWNIQNFFLSSKQSVWSKNSMFCGLFNFDENRCIRTLPAWQFFWLIFCNVENTLPILLKHSKCCSFIKTIILMQKQHVLRTFQFWPKSLYPDLTGVAILLFDFFGWFFWLIFGNVENTLRILLKHSKFCSFIKTISLKPKQHVLRTFQFWPKSLYPDHTGVAILLVDFFSWVFQM